MYWTENVVVELEEPTPYFLKLLATHFYFPVHRSLREKDASAIIPEQFIGNGPFKVVHWKKDNEFVAEKNPLYWDAQAVKLDKIIGVKLSENTAYQMYEAGELDWMGSPLSAIPQDAVHTLKKEGRLLIIPSAGTHWFRLNTAKPPFNNQNMRRAFTLALDRKAIVEHITQGNQTAANGIVPPSFGLNAPVYFVDNDQPKAWELFQKGLNELNIDIDQLPSITLTYSNNERDHKIAQAVQQQWNKAFGISVLLKSQENKTFIDTVKNHNYQIASGSWYADFLDPINFLEVFKYKSNGTNNTEWENPEYMSLLNASGQEPNPLKRYDILRKAEGILMDQMPVAPLFYGAFNYVKEDKISGVYFSELGILDFKHAFIDIDMEDLEVED